MAQPKVITPPAEEITLAEAKLHLRVDITTDDTEITGLIVNAREYALDYTRRSIGSQTLELALDAFPACEAAIRLPQGPVTALTSVTYTDTAGATQTLTGTQLDDYPVLARLFPAYGTTWPQTRCVPNAVKVRYVAGAATTPKRVKTAMFMHIDLHYPGNDYTQQERESIQKAIDALLDTVKVY